MNEGSDGPSEEAALARRLLTGTWQAGDDEVESLFAANYAPYAVLHRSPVEYYSGRDAVCRHFCNARAVFGERRLSLDHVAARPFDDQGLDLAARWTMRCTHSGAFHGAPASGNTLLVLGISHWRLIDLRVVREWTAFDGLAVLAQMIDSPAGAQA